MTGVRHVAAQPAVTDGNPLHHPPAPPSRLDLHYLRASGLAQARLQLAVLSGNRHRALEQIDRLVAIDKRLEQVAEGLVAIAPPPEALEAELTDERLAIASEKLVLAAGIEMARPEPAFGAGLAAAIPVEEPIEIVEEATLKNRLALLLAGALVLLALCLGIGAALTQL
jgi:hypothetical protein